MSLSIARNSLKYFALLPLLLGLLIGFPATGQDQPQPPRGGLNPESFYGKETFQGVSVRDSLEAIKKLEDARRMERLEDWNKAADWYQEVIEKYGDRVVPSGTDQNNNIYQYTGIERPVQEQLAKWPKAGLDTYRNRYGAIAATMLEQAGRDDREVLSKVMKAYFVTDAGRDAALRLIDLLLENGEFAEAARLGDRLLDWHPNLATQRAAVLFRTALAYHLAGDAGKTEQRAEQLKTKYADATGTLFGKDVQLSTALERLLQSPPPVSVTTTINSIPLNPGGNPERSMISAATGRPGARMASIDLSPPPVRVSAQQQREMEAVLGRDRESGLNLGILPAVDDDELYFQDGARVYAVSLASGVPLPGWIQSYPNTSGQYTVNSWSFARSQQYTLTLTESSVLAVMGASQRANNYGGATSYGSDPGTRLVCLRRADGKEKWVVRPASLKLGGDAQQQQNPAVRSLEFSGSPLAVGENVYVIGRGGKNLAAEDCYVLCFDLNSGAIKWSSFIASASNAMAFTGMPAGGGDTLSHLAYSSGRVFVLTNLGAVAAIDAYGGTISWLNIYPRDNANFNPEMGWRGMSYRGQTTGNIKAWEFNPAIVQEGKLFVLPTDGRQNILVYDTATGAEIKRIAVSDFKTVDDTAGPSAIIGVDQDQIILTGGNHVYCLDWTAYERGKSGSGMVWHSEFSKELPSKGYSKTDIRGRGFVTADSVFFCTETNLYRIERRDAKGKITGRVRDIYPARNRFWDEGEGPGNVLVTGEQVIVAGAKRVNVYADMVLARKKLDDDVAAAPSDPEPRLRYAEVMFVAGQIPVAMEKLNEAVELLGGLKALRPGGERDHLFNDCITFAVKLQRDKKSDNIEQMLDAVATLYDLAAAAAGSDAQQVNYRMSRARFCRDYKQEGSLESAVALYQQILQNQRLRTVPLVDEEAGGTTQAALVAEKSINEVKKIKPSAYEAFEKDAGEALLAAGMDPALLKSVAESYPNSSAAPRAMTSAAQAYEAQHNPRLAAHTYGQVLRKYGPSADLVRVNEGLARNFLATADRTGGRVDAAAARLAAIVTRHNAGSSTLSQALVLPDQQVLAPAGTAFTQALKSVQKYKTQAIVSRLADFHLPYAPTDAEKEAFLRAKLQWEKDGRPEDRKPRLTREAFVPEAPDNILESVAAIISPPRELRAQFSRHDRIALWTQGSLDLYSPGAKEATARCSGLPAQPRALAWLEQGALLAAWSETDLTLLRGDNGEKRWAFSLKSLPRIEVIAGSGSEDTIVSTAAADANVEVLGGGQAQIVRRRFGGRMVRQQVQVVAAAAAEPAAAGPEQIIWVRPLEDRLIVATSQAQLFALKIADGTLLWHTRLANNAPIDRLLASDDFVVGKLNDGGNVQLVVLDALTGQLVRRLNFPSDGGTVPVNLALAPDGMLVWTQHDRLCGKDLFEPRKELNYEVVAGQDARGGANPNIQVDGNVVSPIYAGAVQPDQLLVSEGRILALSHAGKYVSIHSLETGKLLDYQQPDGRRAEARLSTVGRGAQAQINDWSVSMTVVGPYLYVSSRQNGPMAYDLDHPAQGWEGTIDPTTQANLLHQDPMIGQDFFVMLGQPARKAAAGAAGAATTYRLHAYSRAAVKDGSGRESGLLVHTRDIRDDAGIIDWEPVEGGFYYLSGDKKLHFLAGARK